MKPLLLLSIIASVLLGGCSDPNRAVLESDESQLKIRSIQTRNFESSDLNVMMRTAIATLQDLGFVIDSADEKLGTITGTKLDGYQLRMTLSVRAKGSKQIVVRASAQYENEIITDPKPYQDFFAALEKAIFLTAHQVD